MQEKSRAGAHLLPACAQAAHDALEGLAQAHMAGQQIEVAAWFRMRMGVVFLVKGPNLRILPLVAAPPGSHHLKEKKIIGPWP